MIKKEEVKKQREKDIFENNKYESKHCLHCIYFDTLTLGNRFPCVACDPSEKHQFFKDKRKGENKNGK